MSKPIARLCLGILRGEYERVVKSHGAVLLRANPAGTAYSDVSCALSEPL